MIYNDILFGSVPIDKVSIDERELATRIGTTWDLENEQFNSAFSKVKDALNYRYAYVRVPVSIKGDVCDLGFASVKSSSLAKVLYGTREAFILAVSAGIDIDRLISRSIIQNRAEAFLIDAIASAAVEGLAEYIDRKIGDGLETTNRFSPGYADFPLEFQINLLERLNSQNTVGIMLSKDLLMTPMKSITAVIGIK